MWNSDIAEEKIDKIIKSEDSNRTYSIWYKKENIVKKNKQSTGKLMDSTEWPNIGVTEGPEDGGTGKILKEIMAQHFKWDENHKSTDSVYSVKPNTTY